LIGVCLAAAAMLVIPLAGLAEDQPKAPPTSPKAAAEAKPAEVPKPKAEAPKSAPTPPVKPAAAPPKVAPAPSYHFERDIQFVLEANCVSCHNPEKVKGELLLHTRAETLKGGESGPAVVEKDVAKSLLVERIALPHDDDDVMPPKGDPLKPEQIEKFKAWINDGAPWPEKLVLRERTQQEIDSILLARAKMERVRTIEIFPAEFSLETRRDHHRLVVLATFDDDTTQDISNTAQLQIADPKLVTRKGSVLRPKEDGETTLTARFGKATATAKIKVSGAEADRPVSFNLDVMPVFMRADCNTGGCHGASRGQDGFRLSLFGYNPRSDYHTVTREMSGRRINLALPEESFLLQKAIEKVPHTGGKLFEENSKEFDLVVEWIRNGAKEDPKEVATVTGIEIYPSQVVLDGKAATQQIGVRATYSDGSDRDVTRWSVFMSNNESCVAIDKNGIATAGQRGEAFLMARFDAYTAGTQAIVVPQGLKYTKPASDAKNYVDELVEAKLHKLRITPSGICDDQTFVRRVYADIIGQLPTPAEQDAFLADKAPDKRNRLIDVLLEKKEFTDMWVMKWAELLQIHSSGNDRRYYKGALLYYQWLQAQISNNVPINEIVVELLSSSGGTFKKPAVSYYEMERETKKVTENVAQVFMGMRIQCAQCHNHPFDRWTMEDYYGFAAFFSQIGRKQAQDAREYIIYNRRSGEINHPVDNKPRTPKFLGGDSPELKYGMDRREVVAEWLASPENPFFAKNISNIIWAHFLGKGIIDPVDDVRISNPATNPELLDELGRRLTTYNYDFKSLVRDICRSSTYQRTTQANDSNRSDLANFSHAYLRRLRAEVVLDAIGQVTETPTKFRGLPLGARAVEIADGATSTYFLTTFGRAKRSSVCSCEVQVDPNLGQALHLLNGETVGGKISAGGVVKRMIDEKKSDADIVNELYRRCFCRPATDVEIQRISETVKKTPSERQAVLEDTFWALLNAKEFIFNH